MISTVTHCDELLVDVLAAARRFVALQARADAIIHPADLAEAIERDFMLFDLHEAGRDLREAVRAAENADLRARVPGTA